MVLTRETSIGRYNRRYATLLISITLIGILACSGGDDPYLRRLGEEEYRELVQSVSDDLNGQLPVVVPQLMPPTIEPRAVVQPAASEAAVSFFTKESERDEEGHPLIGERPVPEAIFTIVLPDTDHSNCPRGCSTKDLQGRRIVEVAGQQVLVGEADHADASVARDYSFALDDYYIELSVDWYIGDLGSLAMDGEMELADIRMIESMILNATLPRAHGGGGGLR